jgi:O-antigen/teichoic acid export membrane protein
MSSGVESRSPNLRRNAIANIAGRAASAVLWIAVTPYALRQLGQERFGVWALFFVLSGYLGVLDLGMSGGVGRFIAVAVARDYRAEARRAILRSLALSVSLGLLWCVACVVGRGPFLTFFHVPEVWAPEVSRSLAIFGFSLLILSVAQVLQYSLIGFQRFDLWNLYYLVGLVVNATLLVVGLAMGRGLIAAACAAVAGQAVVGFLAARSVRACLRRVADKPGGGEGASWRELLRFGAMVQASSAFSVGQMQAGKVMLGALGRLAWVTQFELAFRVTNGFWALPVLIQGAAYPAAAQAHEVGGNEQVREVYAWCCRWVFSLAGLILGLVWLIAPALFRLWLGEGHPVAASAARWLAIAFAMSTLAGPATAIARGIGAPVLEVLNFAVAFVLNLLLGLWFIPRLGPDGAAMAMAVSFAVAAACLLSVLHRRLGISTAAWLLRTAGPRLLPAALVAGALWLAVWRWPLDSRPQSLAAVFVESLLFTFLYVAVTWPTGDARAVWARGRAWLARRAGGVGAARTP